MAGRSSDKHSSAALTAIGFALFAAVLLAGFLAYRGADVGQLPKLVGNLGGGPLVGFEGLRDTVVGSLVAGLIGISWFGLGSFVSSFVRVSRSDDHSHVLELVAKTAIGAAAWSLVWFFLGLAGAYSSAAAIVVTVAGLVLTGISFKRVREATNESRVPEGPSLFDKLLLLLIALPLGLTFISALAPPTAKDTLLYHFALPKAFIAQHSNAYIDGNIASYLSLGTEMHTVWSMLLGNIVSQRASEAAAGVTSFLFFPLLLLAIFGWTRELGASRRWSLIAVAIVAEVPTAYHDASSGYIDIALALFVTLAIYSLCRWWRTPSTGFTLMIAIFLGAALSIKLTAVFVFAAFALVILLRSRNAEGAAKLAAGGFAALVLATVIAAPWYLRTWKATGSPVFPFYMSIWKGVAPGWDVERSNLFQDMNKAYGGDQKGVVDYLLAPVNISLIAQPEDAKYFDGVLGVAFLFGLPVLIWALWKFDVPVEAKIGAGVAAIMFLFWLFSSQQLRYLLPVVPALAVAVAASCQAIASEKKALSSVWQYSLTAAAFAGILTTAAWFCQKAPLRVGLGGETRDQYLTRNLDYYPYYQLVNTDTAADAKVWLINMRRDTYNISRNVYSDYLFEDWTLRKMVWETRSVEELRARTAAMGIQYILARHDFLFDFEKSSLVDDKRPRGENDAKLKMAKDLLLDPSRTVKADNRFSLVKVF